MRSVKVLLATTILVLALAGAAHAGCMATVGLSSTPTGVAPGETWSVDLEVLQHGQTPLSGATPTVILTETASGQEKVFQAVPTGTTGRYRADVVFPSAGTWAVAVNDGFPSPDEECAQTHTFGSFGIGAEAAPPSPPPAEPAPAVAPSDSASFPYWTLGLGAAVLAVLAVALVMLLGRARPRSQQAPLPGP